MTSYVQRVVRAVVPLKKLVIKANEEIAVMWALISQSNCSENRLDLNWALMGFYSSDRSQFLRII